MASMTVLPGKIGLYTITREIGRGGMGIVYLAPRHEARPSCGVGRMPLARAGASVRPEQVPRRSFWRGYDPH